MKTKQKEAPPAIAEEDDIDMGEPSQTDVHVDAPVKKKGQNLAYYKHLAGQMKPQFTDEEYAAMMKKARSHAGGTAKAQNQAAKASEGQNGLMVGLFVSPVTASSLVMEGGELASDLHVTLCYLGDVSLYDRITLAKIITSLQEVANCSGPMTGEISGVGRFESDDMNDADVIYASVDMPGLSDLRERIAQRLTYAGAQPNAEHGFDPHITLAYADGSTASPTGFGGTPIRFDALTLAIGEERLSFPLLSYGAGYFGESNIADLCAHGKASHLFMELRKDCAEAPDWIPYLPLPGDYKHPRYGEIKITPERNANFVDNFKSGKYQEELPIDAEHDTKLSGAFGWVKDMRVNDDGSVDAKVDWTDRGVTAFEEDRFKYFSPEWYDNWEDPTDGTVYSDIAIGGALTTRPFFKEKALRPLVASEKGIFAFDGELNDLKEAYTSIYFTALTASSATQGANMAEDKSVKAGDGKTKTLTELQADLDIANKAIEAHKASEEAARTAAELTATENKKLSERVGSLEKDARTKRFNEQAAKWPGEPANHVLLMETLGEGTEPFNAYVKSQDAVTAQLKSANIFSEMGSSHSASSDVAQNAIAQLEVKTKEIQAAEPKLTYEQAYDRAVTQNPKLYTDIRRGVN